MSLSRAETDELVLAAIAGKNSYGREKVRANCCFCETVLDKVDRKQCLEVNLIDGWFKCYRCNTRGRLTEVPENAATLKPRVRGEIREVKLPEGFCPLWTYDGQKSFALSTARRYLRKDRVGCTPAVLAGAKVGAVPEPKFIKDPQKPGGWKRNPFFERIVVPIYQSGKMVGYMGRLWHKKPPPGSLTYRYSEDLPRGELIYNEEALYIPTEHPAIIVEGIFDTFPFWPEGEALSDGCALLGKTSGGQFEKLKKAKRPILIAFDGDAWRDGEALAMHLNLSGVRAASLKLKPGQDPDECPDWVLAQGRRIFGLS